MVSKKLSPSDRSDGDWSFDKNIEGLTIEYFRLFQVFFILAVNKKAGAIFYFINDRLV